MSFNLKKFLPYALATVIGMGAFSLFGFQSTTEKFGVVDINKILQDSELGKATNKKLQDALSIRSDLLKFISTYKVLTVDQANKLRELTLKPTPTAADKSEIERIKGEIIAADKKRNELLQKSNMTDTDRMQLQDYAQRAQTMAQVVEQFNNEFQQELNAFESQVREDTITKTKETVKEVAKSQGFTVVLESSVVPYAANDITDASIKALNAKTK
jgi:Skp family chaperone for outer membrane proteins